MREKRKTKQGYELVWFPVWGNENTQRGTGWGVVMVLVVEMIIIFISPSVILYKKLVTRSTKIHIC